ncbi:Ctl2 [Symbiodinium sp. CCMP2592]|nr:Ctl2 [Symbiodinium sp. CCMP2592]
MVHVVGIGLWLAAVLGVRTVIEQDLTLDWRSQFNVVCALLLCFLWGSAFVTGLSTFVVAHVASRWYARGPLASSESPVQALLVGLRYHAGSIALGSLLLAFVRLLNILLWWAEKAQDEVVQQAVPGGPRRRQRPPSCMRSFRNFAAEILEAVATWASKQAFVQVAISGCGFVPGATKAARLSASAPLGFLVVEGLANAFHRICELFLIGLAVVIASAWGCEGFKELLPPAAAAWLAAESLLHPYSVATTTILHCILMDTHTKQENDRAPSEASSLRAVMEQWDREEVWQQPPSHRGSRDKPTESSRRKMLNTINELLHPPGHHGSRDQAHGILSAQDGKRQQDRHADAAASESEGPKRRRTAEGHLDWTCANCSAHNYSYRGACFRCKMPRGPGVMGERRHPEEPSPWQGAEAAACANGAGGLPAAENTFTVIEVPESYIGLLIGKGGYDIRQLQACTGAAVQVGKLSFEGSRKVCLNGSAEAQAAAEAIIKRKLMEWAEKDAYKPITDYILVPMKFASKLIGPHGCVINQEPDPPVPQMARPECRYGQLNSPSLVGHNLAHERSGAALAFKSVFVTEGARHGYFESRRLKLRPPVPRKESAEDEVEKAEIIKNQAAQVLFDGTQERCSSSVEKLPEDVQTLCKQTRPDSLLDVMLEKLQNSSQDVALWLCSAAEGTIDKEWSTRYSERLSCDEAATSTIGAMLDLDSHATLAGRVYAAARFMLWTSKFALVVATPFIPLPFGFLARKFLDVVIGQLTGEAEEELSTLEKRMEKKMEEISRRTAQKLQLEEAFRIGSAHARAANDQIKDMAMIDHLWSRCLTG